MKKFLLATIISLLSLTSHSQLLNTQPTETLSITEQLELNYLKTHRQNILDFATTFIGVPYRWAANGPHAFDCSGYTKYVFNKFGYTLQRTASGQATQGIHVSTDEAQTGDLVFFRSKRKSVGHVGIVVARDDEGFFFIHASCSRGIMINHVQEPYYKKRYRFCRRIICNEKLV